MFRWPWSPVGLALGSALPGGPDAVPCKVTSRREDLLLVRVWVLLPCFSVPPAVANGEDQHSHHELRNQEPSNDVEDGEISFKRDAMENHKYNSKAEPSRGWFNL